MEVKLTFCERTSWILIHFGVMEKLLHKNGVSSSFMCKVNETLVGVMRAEKTVAYISISIQIEIEWMYILWNEWSRAETNQENNSEVCKMVIRGEQLTWLASIFPLTSCRTWQYAILIKSRGTFAIRTHEETFISNCIDFMWRWTKSKWIMLNMNDWKSAMAKKIGGKRGDIFEKRNDTLWKLFGMRLNTIFTE